jgi:phosphoribosylformylglycinamidine synthase subunit PurSL
MGVGSALTHCLVVSRRQHDDPRALGLLSDANVLGLRTISSLECHDLYFVEGELSYAERERLAAELLTDPLTQFANWREEQTNPPAATAHIIEVALRPGVTDPVADQVVRCAQMLGLAGVSRVSTGQRFVVCGPVEEQELHTLARRLLANDVIQRYALGEITPVFPHLAEASATVDVVLVRKLDDNELLALSRERRAALDLREMQAIQVYFRSMGRDPTDIEFETIAQTWSEHCVHKTFKALIEVEACLASDGSDLLAASPQVVDGIFKTYIRAATEAIGAAWVRSAFVDNAGIIDFDEEYEVSFKVETHNHPSAIEPFGGANTGVGGVIRDVLGVSAKPIAATDVLCFGPQAVDSASLPDGVLHPRRIRAGVVAGIQDYGNKIGIPTVNGAIVYDEGYTANPLVFCGCVGIAPKGSHTRGPHPGDRVIVLGGRTGRDGLRGATFSSMSMDAQTGEVAGASVQIGDPISEKGLIEVITRARHAGLYHAITDCGAGGLSSAVGEMGSDCGVDVDLRDVRLKYPGLAPWEIWLSEAQERMALAVPSGNKAKLQALCHTFDVELTDVGVFTDTGHLIVRYGRVVLDVANEFLHHGQPRRRLTAQLPSIETGALVDPAVDPAQRLLRLLADPNIASKEDVIRIYDHEILGGTVVKPLTGARDDGPSDACVLKPLYTRGTRGLVLSCGINPDHGKRDPYGMAVSVVDEAIRNAVAVGADPERIALLDNFCWGDPSRPETLGALVEAARGCHDAALCYRTPFISGKDSLNNEYVGADGDRHAIPPTLLISAIGIIEDVNAAVTMDLKEVGNRIYLVGARLKSQIPNSDGDGPAAGGQHSTRSIMPALPVDGAAVYRCLHRAMRAGLVRACHDLSEGGLAVAAAEMCIGGRLGMTLTAAADEMFVETNSRLLVEVREADCAAFEPHFEASAVVRHTGQVRGDSRFVDTHNAQTLVDLEIGDLVRAWKGHV